MRFSCILAAIVAVTVASAQPILKERNGSASVKDVQCWYACSISSVMLHYNIH